jgi:hypothetical protein
MMKIIAVCDSLTLEVDLKDVCPSSPSSLTHSQSFHQLHDIFVTAIQNPFQQLGHPLSSVRFQEKVKQIIKKFNTITPPRVAG